MLCLFKILENLTRKKDYDNPKMMIYFKLCQALGVDLIFMSQCHSSWNNFFFVERWKNIVNIFTYRVYKFNSVGGGDIRFHLE